MKKSKIIASVITLCLLVSSVGFSSANASDADDVSNSASNFSQPVNPYPQRGTLKRIGGKGKSLPPINPVPSFKDKDRTEANREEANEENRRLQDEEREKRSSESETSSPTKSSKPRSSKGR